MAFTSVSPTYTHIGRQLGWAGHEESVDLHVTQPTISEHAGNCCILCR